jgi:hypothetical protein
MAYIFKQKLKLSDLASLAIAPKRVLIYEPEKDLAALYAYYLSEQNFEIKHCLDFEAIRQSVINFQPNLLIFSTDSPDNLPKIRLFPVALIKEFPSLRVISTGYNLSGQGIGELMAIGVISHINRRLSRPQDLAILVTTLLQ